MRPHHGQRPARRHHHPQEHPPRSVGRHPRPGIAPHHARQGHQPLHRHRAGPHHPHPPRPGDGRAALHGPAGAGPLPRPQDLEPPHALRALPRAQRQMPPAGGHRSGRCHRRALRDLHETHAGVHAPHLPPRRPLSGRGRPPFRRGVRVLPEDPPRLLPQHGDEVPQELQEDHPHCAGPRVDAARPLRRDPLLAAARQARDARKVGDRAADAQGDRHPAAGPDARPLHLLLLHGARLLGHQAARTRAHRHRHAGPPLDPQAAPEDRQHVQHPAAGDPRADSAALPHGSRVRGAQRAAARVEQPEDERLPEGAGRHLRHPQTADDPLRKALFRHLHAGQRRLDRERRQDARTLRHEDDAPLRQGARPDHPARDERPARRPVIPTAMESVFTGSITIDGEQVTVRRTAGGEVWLTQSEIARLFGVFEAAVRANIRAIYRSEALRRGRTLRIVHGVELYSLEMIAALAFRLRSLESEAFRRWLLRPAGPEIRLVAIAGEEPVC